MLEVWCKKEERKKAILGHLLFLMFGAARYSRLHGLQNAEHSKMLPPHATPWVDRAPLRPGEGGDGAGVPGDGRRLQESQEPREEVPQPARPGRGNGSGFMITTVGLTYHSFIYKPEHHFRVKKECNQNH